MTTLRIEPATFRRVGQCVFLCLRIASYQHRNADANSNWARLAILSTAMRLLAKSLVFCPRHARIAATLTISATGPILQRRVELQFTGPLCFSCPFSFFALPFLIILGFDPSPFISPTYPFFSYSRSSRFSLTCSFILSSAPRQSRCLSSERNELFFVVVPCVHSQLLGGILFLLFSAT